MTTNNKNKWFSVAQIASLESNWLANNHVFVLLTNPLDFSTHRSLARIIQTSTERSLDRLTIVRKSAFLTSDLRLAKEKFLFPSTTVSNFLFGLSVNLSEAIEDFFLIQINSAFSAGTPSSEVLFARSTDIWQGITGRNGEDTLIAFDPDNTTSENFAYHILRGDEQEADITFSRDTFVLGDWQRAYYNDGNYEIVGLKQVAQITDFQIELDKIQLHGSANNYYLREIPPSNNIAGGTAVFQVTRQGIDLIAIISGVFGLDIRGDYFQYEGTTAPAVATGELTKIGQLGSPAFEYASTIAWNANNENLIVAGFSSGNLGSATPPQDIANNGDIFWANYDSRGTLLGVEQFGSLNFQWEGLTFIDTDNRGNLYLAGTTTGNVARRNQTSPEGFEDIFVAKYDATGNLEWLEQFGTSGSDVAFAIDVDPDGNFFYLSGIEVTYPALSGEEGTSPIDDTWVGKYDASNGQEVWSNKFGTGDEFDESYAVGVDKQGNVFAAGFTKGDLGATNQGAYDIWIAKFDAEGQQQGIQQFGGAAHEFAWGLKLDSEGNVYVTGWTESDLDGQLNGQADYFIAKYDNDLNRVWVEQFGSSGYDGTYGLYIDANDDLYVSGYSSGVLEGDNAGGYDAFATKFDRDGNKLWTQQFGTDKDDRANAITGDNLGNIYLTGTTQGSFGALNAGSVDSWVAKLNAADGSILNFNPSTADTFS